MQLEKIDLDEAHCFSSLFLDYINQDKKLTPYYNLFPSVENFNAQIAQKKFSTTKRNTLADVLTAQYQGIDHSSAVEQNITALRDGDTFTITTGHQLNIFTGPLYFIYKIATVVNTCKQLKKAYPNYHFVPVYWMASEDHDFEEINNFRLDGKKHTWHSDQTGAVGRFDPSSIRDVLNAIPGKNELFEKAYLESDTLAEAGRKYVNALFGDEGVVVVDADNRALKKQFTEVMTADIFTNQIVDVVDQTTSAINGLGYKTQVNARDINFFYLDEQLRSRIVHEDGQYKVLDTALSFSADEMKKIIADTPEKISPNVVLRPLYQEMILPNLAYIGGPAEAAYWLQLSPVFSQFDEAFPMLMPRNFALVVDKNSARKVEKHSLSYADLFLDRDALSKKVTLDDTAHDLSYQAQIKELNSLYDIVATKANIVDPTLKLHVDALKTKAANLMDEAEKKLIRAEKKHHAIKLQQVETVKSTLFPNNNLQERTDNFLNFQQHNPEFIKDVLANFDPFDYRFHILIDNG